MANRNNYEDMLLAESIAGDERFTRAIRLKASIAAELMRRKIERPPEHG